MKKHYLLAGVMALAVAGLASQASANGYLATSNGLVQLGVNDDGSLDASTSAGYVGLGYKFSGQGGRTGFQDALTPGCPCEAWGVSANGHGGQVGPSTGNQNIAVGASSSTASSFTSHTSLSTVPGLTVTQTYSVATESAAGGLFVDKVTIHNGTGGALSNVDYARAMDWDVPPTEFSEYVTIKGTGTTTTLLHSTDNGFANANPITAVSDGGIVGPINADGTTGPSDHGSLFVFGFGNLADGADYTFNIYYGAAANEAGALGLLSAVSPELYSLGQTSYGGTRGTNMPTFIFAFNGVGGSVVVPPNPGGVPEPASWSLMILGVGGVGAAMRRRRTLAAA
jgi:type IV pilus assembly protein PilY1